VRLIICAFLVFVCGMTGFALADGYRLKAGDILDITVWQDAKLNRQIVVAPDGLVSFPLAGRFKVGGLTTGAAESTLKARLQKQYKEELDVTVSYIQSAKKEPKDPLPPKEPEKIPEWTVYVTGEVLKPGAFVVPKKAPSVLQALALSGGVGPFAAERRIQIHRKSNGNEIVYDFDYTRYTEGGDTEGNITLRNGDVIVVPERGLFE
jgi:polysaccharide biosynthesis/export protein